MDVLNLGISSSEVRDNTTGKQTLWHRCHLDKGESGPRVIWFRFWLDRKAAIAEAREFVQHLDLYVDDQIVD